jgi:peptidyl-tRNA hydrolase
MCYLRHCLTRLVLCACYTAALHVWYFAHAALPLYTAKPRQLKAKVAAAVSRVFVAAQVCSGVYVAGWEHLSKVSCEHTVSSVQAMLEWDIEVLEKVFVQMQQSDDIKALDSKLSVHFNKIVCVSDCTTLQAYLEVVGITV